MRNKGNNSTSLFDELPRSFQAEVSLETFKTMMEKVTQVYEYLALSSHTLDTRKEMEE